jgi:hypothetical protein
MARPATLPALGLPAVVVYAQTDATRYRGGKTDVTQTAAPGAIANEQVRIIGDDEFGNQRGLSIGGSGRILMGARLTNSDCVSARLDAANWVDGRRCPDDAKSVCGP